MTSLEKDNKICPAILPIEETSKEMSVEEFQRTLISWFEDRGLLIELRAHLRKQMISMLKGTTIEQTTNKKTKHSPKDHVSNLLVAEYLLKQHYHYSLSVFSSEAPYFIDLLPDLSNICQPLNNEVLNIRNFTQPNFYEILESLGYLPESFETKILYDLYYQSKDKSLLGCMIKLLPKLTKLKIQSKEKIEDTAHLETWLKDIHNLLIHFEVNSSYIHNLSNQIKLIFERECNKIKYDEEMKFKNKQTEINKDIVKREADIKILVNEMETTFNIERTKMSEQHMKELKNIERTKLQYKQFKNEYESKFELLQMKEEYITQREEEFEKQLKILNSRTTAIEQAYNSVIDNENYNVDIEKVENETQTDNKYLTKTSINKEIQTISPTENSDHNLTKQMLERIQNENSTLRILNVEQQRRLELMSNQNSTLLLDLENCQSTIAMLTRINSGSTIVVPPVTCARRNYRNPNLGGGENLGYMGVSTSPPLYRHAHYRNYSRRKPRKESSSSSPTEDVLLEARERLRRLENESEDIDRHYRDYRERQNHETFSFRNIPESIRAEHSQNRETVFSMLRPTFQSRISELPSTSQNKSPIFKFSASNFFKDNKDCTSFKFDLSRENGKVEKESVGDVATRGDENRFSGGSSGISQLLNLSLSSVDVSDTEGLSDEEKN